MRGQKLSKKCPYCRGTGINQATIIHIDKDGLILQVTPALLQDMKRFNEKSRKTGKSTWELWIAEHRAKWEAEHKRPFGMPIEEWNKLGITWEEWKNGKNGTGTMVL